MIPQAGVVAAVAGLAASMHGCGGAMPGTTAPAATTTSRHITVEPATTTVPTAEQFCCYYSPGKGSEFCASCTSKDFDQTQETCKMAGQGAVWCGPHGPETTSMGPTSSTKKSDTSWVSSTSTRSTAVVTTTKCSVGNVKHSLAGFKDGHYCKGTNGYDRKVIEHDCAARSLDQCAQVVHSDSECSRTFYFGTSAQKPSICRCVLKERTCIDSGAADDNFQTNIYKIQPDHVVEYSEFPDRTQGQWCSGDYDVDRKMVTALHAGQSADNCAQAVFDDFECSDVFYFGESNTSPDKSLCRCVVAGKTCKVSPRSDDGIHCQIYKLQQSRPPTVPFSSWNVDGYCGVEDRKQLDDAGGSPSDCAQAAARDVACGQKFYYHKGRNGDASRCVCGGKDCIWKVNPPDDPYGNTIYLLGTSAATTKLLGGPSPLLVHRNWTFKSEDGQLWGTLVLQKNEGAEVYMNFQYDWKTKRTGSFELWSEDNGKTFGTSPPDAKGVIVATYHWDSRPPWLADHCYDHTNPMLELQV